MTTIFSPKTIKCLPFFALVALLFFTAYKTLAQQRIADVSIVWKNVPDSVSTVSVLFEDGGFVESFPVPCYFKEFTTIRNQKKSVKCVGVLYDTSFEFVSKAEEIFLTKTGTVIPDTLYYNFYGRTLGDSTIFGLCLLPYIRTNNGFQKLKNFSISYRFDTIAGCMAEKSKSLSNSVLANGEWFKIAVNTTGIHRISVSDFESSGVRVRGKNIADLAIFGNGGGPLPEKNSEPRIDDLAENAIFVADENNDGIFNNNDYILFYAEAANVWRYNSTSKWFEYVVHPYSTENYYFFTCTSGIGSGKRITDVSVSGLTTTSNTYTYIARSVINNDLVNTHNTGQIWVGEKFSSSTPSRTFNLSVPNPMIAGSNLHARYALASVSKRNSSFTIDWGNGRNSINLYPLASNYVTDTNNITISGGNTASFTITYNYGERLAAGYLDFIEINAVARLRFVAGQTDFRNFGSGTANSATKIHLSNCNRNVRVWDVSDLTNVRNMTGTFSNDTLLFSASNESLREYIAFDGSSYYSPLRITPTGNQNLHALSSIDYVIVSHENYLEQAERIADLHRIYDGLTVAVVTPEQVYNEFSSGKQDAVAIRSLMKMLFDKNVSDPSESAPRHLLLFGKASYDNRNLKQNNQNTVVVYQSYASFDNEGVSYATDDFFGYLHDSESGLTRESLDIGIGRLPARTTEEARIMTDKIENYITRKDFDISSIKGDWRNSVVFLADDADPGAAGDVDFLLSSEYTTEKISEKFPFLNIEKIYADAYVQQSGAIGSFYPDVKNALAKSINYGCLLLNYVGHGAWGNIGSERYMDGSDIESYTNKYTLPFFMASTCTFGKFDMTDELSGGERFVMSANGGGIAIVAASRPISHSRSFDTKICMDALDHSNGRQNTLGDALMNAKNAVITPHAVNLIGDPALRLSIPDKQVTVTKINNKSVCDSIADTATVLSQITIEGEIRNADGSIANNFDGKIYATVFDRSATYYTLANDNEDTETPFTQQKSVIAKSTDTIAGGHFSYTFIVPKDVAYKYDFGKLSHYAQSGNSNATGCYKNVLFGGFNEEADNIVFRPLVRLFMNDSLFISGGSTDNNPSLYAILSDKVGINSVGSGIGHDITAILDGNANKIIVLNDFFETDINDNARGYIRYPLYNLAEGTHTLTLKAWNVYNYSSSATITFEVKNGSPKIGRFFAYPNPAREKVSIHIEHNSPSKPTNAEVYIFDASGRMVRKITPAIDNGSYVVGNVEWDFRNESGAKVTNGVYYMRAIVSFDNGEQDTKSAKLIYNK